MQEFPLLKGLAEILHYAWYIAWNVLKTKAERVKDQANNWLLTLLTHD